MESSRREFFIDIVVGGFILKNNQITLSPCFTFIPKTDEEPKAEAFFVCEKV